MRYLQRIIVFGLGVVAALAILEQIVRDPEYRTWHGRMLGVPYDFRPPTFARIKTALWAPDDPHILSSHVFGVGWTPNLGRIAVLLKDLRAGQ